MQYIGTLEYSFQTSNAPKPVTHSKVVIAILFILLFWSKLKQFVKDKNGFWKNLQFTLYSITIINRSHLWRTNNFFLKMCLRTSYLFNLFFCWYECVDQRQNVMTNVTKQKYDTFEVSVVSHRKKHLHCAIAVEQNQETR